MKNEVETPNLPPTLSASKGYKALAEMIRRQNKRAKSKPAKLATFYIECFILHRRKLSSDLLVALEICDPGKFSEWRNDQRRLGNLDWTIEQRGGKPYWNYIEGPKLMKHLNRIAQENGLYATKGYVDNKIDQLKTELKTELRAQMRAELDEFIKQHMPPVTEEKREALLYLAHSINESQKSPALS